MIIEFAPTTNPDKPYVALRMSYLYSDGNHLTAPLPRTSHLWGLFGSYLGVFRQSIPEGLSGQSVSLER